MTPTGKPDDDHEAERPDPGEPAQVPPPPRWLDDQGGPSGPLLPTDGPVRRLPAGPPAPEPPAPEPPAADDSGDDDAEAELADRTMLEFRFERDVAGPAAEPPAAGGPAGIPAPPPFPYAQEMPDATRVQPHPAPARPPAPQPPAPQPPELQPPAPPAHMPPPAPPVQLPAPRPPVAQPPVAQPPPAQSPPAHDPFPYAQEIPGAPPRPAPEPFPYAQEVPGAPSAPPAAQPFPWAQQVPGAPPAAQDGVQPAAPPPPAVDEPWRTTPSRPKKARRSLKKPLLIAGAGLAAAALVAAAVIVVPGLLGDGEDEGGASAKLAGALFPVDGAAATDGRDQQISGIAALGSTVVAVGGETDPQNARGLFLVSTDAGRTFKSVSQQSTDGGAAPSGGVPEAVGGSSRGWVAIGSRAGGGGAVWTSENGTEWRRQPDAVGDVFGPKDRVKRIVGTRGGFMAIGENSPKGDFSDSRPAVWLSADGRRWEARIGDQTGLGVQKAKLSLVEAAASGDVILLEGLVTPDSKKPGPYRKVWRSQDAGRTWATSDVPVPKGSRGLMIGGGPAGFLAMREIKASGKLAGQAFLSKDGRTWTKAGTLSTPGYRMTSGITGDEQGFTAVVVRTGDTLLSRSADGRTWRGAGTAESKPGRELTGAAASGGQTVLVGREPGGGDTNAVLGVWDANGTAVPVDPSKISGAVRPDHSVRSVGATGNLAVAVGSASGDAAVWSSRDGNAWKPAQGLGAAFTRPGPQQLNDVAAGTAGWVAVGYDQAAARRPLVVTSSDGATWQAADSAAAFAAGKAGQPVTYAVTAGSKGYVVIGNQGYSVATWFSPDLRNWTRGAGTDPKMMVGGEADPRWMLDVAAGQFGYAAVGGSRGPQGNRPSVWMSPDGKTWTLQELQLPGSGVTEAHLTHVAARENTIVVAGIAATPKGIDWIGYVSTDGGRTWRPIPSPSGDTLVTVTAMAATPKGFAATGTSGRAGATDVVSWTSPDGVSWKATTPGGTGLAGVGDQQITGLAAFGGTLLGVGRSADANGDQPVLWARSN